MNLLCGTFRDLSELFHAIICTNDHVIGGGPDEIRLNITSVYFCGRNVKEIKYTY